MFEAIVSESGESAMVDTNPTAEPPEGGKMPFTLMLFGQEAVRRWAEGTDEDRVHTVTNILVSLTMICLAGATDEEAATFYNVTAASQGIDNHAVLYTP